MARGKEKEEKKKMRRVLIRRMEYGDCWVSGRLYVDGSFVCGTLEGTYRHLTEGASKRALADAMRYNSMAVPSGVYVCRPRWSSSVCPSRCSLEVERGKLAELRLVRGVSHLDAVCGSVVVGDVLGAAVYKSDRALSTLRLQLANDEAIVVTVV